MSWQQRADVLRREFPAAFAAVAERLSDGQLAALAAACEAGDPRLIHGVSVFPAGLGRVRDWPAERACAVGFCALVAGFVEDVLLSVGTADGRVVTNVWDELSEGEARRLFARACREVLAGRKGVAA